MILRVDSEDPTPVYEQIRGQIAVMVAAGILTPGSRLPTIRQLAADLGLAKGTVAKAYESLLRDGIARSEGRSGTVIAPDRTPEPSVVDAQLAEAARNFAVRTHQLGVDARTAVEAFVKEADRLR